MQSWPSFHQPIGDEIKLVMVGTIINRDSLRALVRPLGIPLIGEGGVMLLCMLPALFMRDGTAVQLLVPALFTISVGLIILVSIPRHAAQPDRKMSYLLVTLIWIVLSFFGTLPFLTTGSNLKFCDAFFEAMSGLTSTGATIFSDVEHLPPSILLWRSIIQWIGGFGIVLLVLAIVPSLGINKHSLYTAETSGADNTGKSVSSTSITVRRTLSVYLAMTIIFIVMLRCSGLPLWDSINLTFTNISSGGFSIYNDSIASLTHLQQYMLAGAMFLSGINIALLFNLVTFQFSKIKSKLDQFSFYLFVLICSITFVIISLHDKMGYSWNDSLRMGIVQTISCMTTSGSLIADTTIWWVPLTFLFLMLSLCGGMAGSTTGGLKVMRVIILVRNARMQLRNRLHPNAVNPVRLNGTPVASHFIDNVLVIFFIYVFTMLFGFFALMLCKVNASESFGAVVACLTGYGPGLGASGGFGSYAGFSVAAKWISSFLMLLGRLECLTVFILFLPGFWRK